MSERPAIGRTIFTSIPDEASGVMYRHLFSGYKNVPFMMNSVFYFTVFHKGEAHQ